MIYEGEILTINGVECQGIEVVVDNNLSWSVLCRTDTSLDLDLGDEASAIIPLDDTLYKGNTIVGSRPNPRENAGEYWLQGISQLVEVIPS